MKGEKTMESVISDRPLVNPIKWYLCAARVALDSGELVKADEFICAAIHAQDMEQLQKLTGNS
jgi:hypothetical protein